MAYEPKNYPDSETSARLFIRDETIFHIDMIETLVPDPMVAGCWKATLTTNKTIIIYIGDHTLAPDHEVNDG